MKPENLRSIRLSTISAVVILALGVTLSLLAGPQAAGSGNPPLRTGRSPSACSMMAPISDRTAGTQPV
jgi:hypothetical protein